MKFEATRDQYGPKIAVELFPDGNFDHDVVKRVKNCDWATTHRQYDGDVWSIDANDSSITEFERKTGETVPAEFKSEQSGSVQITTSPTRFFVTAPDAAHAALDVEFSYQDPDAEHMTDAQMGSWDGMNHVYKQGFAPIGLVDSAVALLEERGFDVTIDGDEGTDGDKLTDLRWEFDHTLRDYQFEAVAALVANDRGVIALPTGAGKTITAMSYLYSHKRRALVVVHTRELLYQWAENIRDTLSVEPGMIGDGLWSEGPITVAIAQSLVSRGTSELRQNYGVIVCDECHRTSAAETYNEVASHIEAKKRFGLSATPWRRVSGEELLMKGVVGDEIASVSAESLIQQGYLAEPTFETIEHRTPKASGKYHNAYAKYVEFGVPRNTAIVERAAELANDGRRVLVSVNRVSQAYVLAAALSGEDLDTEEIDTKKSSQAADLRAALGDMNVRAEALTSGSSERDAILERFESGETDVLVSTLVREGVDLPAINAVILADGLRASSLVIQVIGRALRPNGGDAIVCDVADEGQYFGSAFEDRQATLSEYYGSYF